MTSKPRLHAVLFTKEDCRPCKETKAFIYDLLENNIHLYETLSFLKKENHSALVEAYDLNLYPTLIITDGADAPAVETIVGGKNIRACIESKLIEIYRENQA